MASKYVGLVVLAMAVASQAASVARPAGETCIDPAWITSNRVAFPSQFHVINAASSSTQVTFARDFEVTYYSTYKVVRNLRQNETFVLYPCGLAPPSGDALPAGAKVFEVPLTQVSVDDASVLAFLKLLGVQDRVTFTSPYAVDSCQQSLGIYGCNRTAPSLSPFSDSGRAALTAASSQVDAFFTFSANSNTKSISVSAAPDPGVLNRAEWIKYVSTFFNKEDVANNVFAAIAQRFNNLKTGVNTTLTSTPSAQKPLVAWVYYQPENPAWGPVWGRGSVAIQFAAYRQEYTEAAGGRILGRAAAQGFADGTNVVLSGTSLYLYNFTTIGADARRVLADVDIVIDETRYPDVRNQDVSLTTFMNTLGLTAQDIPTLKFLRDNKVLRVDAVSNPDGYTDWYEMALARPDLVLQDLIAVITPAAFPSTANAAQPRFVRNLAAAQPVLLQSTQTCTAVTGCRFSVAPICPLIYKDCSGNIVAATAEQRCAPTCPTTPTTSTPAPAPNAGTQAMTAPFVLLAALLAALIMAAMI